MARVELITWLDVIDHLVDWMGANPTQEARRDARRASLNALRDVANAHHWMYYYNTARINTVAPYDTGTIEYDHTGGAFERLVTLTGGTWPDWSAQGFLVIEDVRYEVASRLSATTITLSVNSNPGADVAAETEYTIVRDQYNLPSNFHTMGEVIIVNQSRCLHYEHPSRWMSRQRVWRGMATPYTYSIMGDPNYQNTLTLALYPPPDNVYELDFIYKRKPRALRMDSYSAGTVTGTSGNAGLTGTNTLWTSALVGSVIRIGTSDLPTSRWGSNPASQERIITAVSSSTSLTVDANWSDSFTAVKYQISDPVDVETNSMLTLLFRAAELQTSHARQKMDRGEIEAAYNRELIRAREADSRSFQEQQAGRMAIWPFRLADYPLGADS